MNARLVVFAVLTLIMFPVRADYSYGPESRAEWDGWPEYCKARFTVSLIGGTSEYATAISPDRVAYWSNSLGECFGMLHHHCASLLAMGRARASKSRSEKNYLIEAAIKEDKFAAGHCPAENTFSANIATHLAMAYFEQGQQAKAVESVDWVIRMHPSYDWAYIFKAKMLKSHGEATAAKEVLKLGSEATKQGSAELEIALGFAFLDSKEFELAREHAKKGYALGYPLPALRDRLKKAGYAF